MTENKEGGTINCLLCNSEFIYIKTRQLCRKCYSIERSKLGKINTCIDCGNNERTCKGRCHTCYERKRRNKLIDEAKQDESKANSLRLHYRNEYLKTKANGYYKTLSRRVSSAINTFKSRDSESEIDEEWYIENIVGKNCHYCNIDELTAKKYTGQNLNVDKKIPSSGYKKLNCVPACKACNTAKLDIWTYEETKKLGLIIKELYKLRS